MIHQVEDLVVDHFRMEFLKVHVELARPMLKREIITEAQRRGYSVTEQTFDSVYK